MKDPIEPLSPEYFKLSKEGRVDLAVDRLNRLFESVRAFITPVTTIDVHRKDITRELIEITDEAEKDPRLSSFSPQVEGWMVCDEVLATLFSLIHAVVAGVASKNLKSPEMMIACQLLAHISPTLVKILPELLGADLTTEKKKNVTGLPKLTEKQVALN